MHLTPFIKSAIQQKLSKGVSSTAEAKFYSVTGGSINETYRISFAGQNIFCKINSASKFPQLFIKEKNGLALLQQANVISTPCMIDYFTAEDKQVLLLEWIHEGARNEAFWERFGKQLALLHHRSADHFGLHEDNFMGSVPQCNYPHATWPSFFVNERLEPMLRRCYEKHLLTKKHLDQFNSLANKLETIFESEPPSLVHGDLWNGNFMCNQNNEPVLIDPAVYYGHRSMDLAMTTLFGGFRASFYKAYHHHFPLPSNHQEQWPVCNLYPLLIHLFLFGNAYLSQIDHTLKQFV